jgi:hypothetical protein
MGLSRQDPQARDHDAVRLAVRPNPHKENSDNDDQNFPDSRKEKQGRAAAGTFGISVEAKAASKALAAELACDEEPLTTVISVAAGTARVSGDLQALAMAAGVRSRILLLATVPLSHVSH